MLAERRRQLGRTKELGAKKLSGRLICSSWPGDGRLAVTRRVVTCCIDAVDKDEDDEDISVAPSS